MKRRYFPPEWFAQSAVQLTFPHKNSDWATMLVEAEKCFIRIIETIANFEKVLVVCADVQYVQSLINKKYHPQIVFVALESNDTWSRDHGGITVYEDENPVILDFIFNGWGMKFAANHDNLITQKLFQKNIFSKNVRHESIPFVLEGGSLETDGNDTLLTTTECLLSQNRQAHLSKQKITSLLKKYLGVQKVIWLTHGYLAGDDTDSHIDTLARFADAKTIMYVRCNDKKDEHYSALKKMEAQLKKATDLYNAPYKLVALPMCTACFDAEGNRLPATYANFLIINDAVLVPTYNIPEDELALEIFRKHYTHKKVTGIDCRVLIEQHGSLHCVTMQYPKEIVGSLVNS